MVMTAAMRYFMWHKGFYPPKNATYGLFIVELSQ
jgi:hypothetical protein